MLKDDLAWQDLFECGCNKMQNLALLQNHPGERKAVHERNAVHAFLWRCLKVIQNETPVHLQLIEISVEVS